MSVEPFVHSIDRPRILPPPDLDPFSPIVQREVTSYCAAEIPHLPFHPAAGVAPGDAHWETKANEQATMLDHLKVAELGATFALRITGGAAANTRLWLLARSDGRSHEESRARLREAFRTLLSAVPDGYPAEPATGQDAFFEAFQPFEPRDQVEVRRLEEQRAVGIGAGYIVYPLRAANRSLLRLMSLLPAAQARHSVTVWLRPVIVESEEVDALATVASEFRRLSSEEFVGHTVQVREVDEWARMGADLWDQTLRELGDVAFLMRVAVTAAGPVETPILRALTALLTATRETGSGADDARRAAVATDVELVPDRTGRRDSTLQGGELTAAVRNSTLLEFGNWGPTRLPEGWEVLGRLRYLFGSHHAHAAFRLPVADTEEVPGLRVVQAGRFVSVRAPVEADEAVRVGEVMLRGQLSGQDLHVPIDALTRHSLVVGHTGSGKSTTCIYLLDQLWREHGIPFLVFESAKGEYRALRAVPGYESLQVFTLGNEAASPFRFNPFDLPPYVAPGSFIPQMCEVVGAVLPLWGPLPGILRQAISRAYTDRGWSEWGGNEGLEPPIFTDVLGHIKTLLDAPDRSRDLQERYGTALMARVESLTHGMLGRMLNARHSIPMDVLCETPTVLELQPLGADDIRGLVLGMLLIHLRYYIENRSGLGSPAHDTDRALKHVTLIEEAHRLLKNVATESTNEEASLGVGAFVGQFCDMLAEIRAYGEGLMIADQLPNKLAPDVVKNTNLKVVQKLPGEDDVRSLASAMAMTPERAAEIPMLGTFEGMAYADVLPGPATIRVPNYKRDIKMPPQEEYPDSRVVADMAPFFARHAELLHRHSGCRACKVKDTCPYGDAAAALLGEGEILDELRPHLLPLLIGETTSGLPALRRTLLRSARSRLRMRLDRAALPVAAHCVGLYALDRLVETRAQAYTWTTEHTTDVRTGLAETVGELLGGGADGEQASACLATLRARHQAAFDADDMLADTALDVADACEWCERRCMMSHETEPLTERGSLVDPFMRALKEDSTDAAAWMRAASEAVSGICSAEDPVARGWVGYCFAVNAFVTKGGETPSNLFRRAASLIPSTMEEEGQ